MPLMKKFHIKSEIRILGIDDSASLCGKVIIVGTFFRGSTWLDGVIYSKIEYDGMDGTDAIIKMIQSSKHYTQIRIIMLDGITYAGFNPIDIHKIYYETSIPVIVIIRKIPNFKKIKAALKHLRHSNERFEIIKRAGKISSVFTKKNLDPVYIQYVGIHKGDAKHIVKLTSIRSKIPEPLRIAHIIATKINTVKLKI
ncbi:MAG: DUF99 family protein [Methanosarcinales archaeon]|nr:DUF99 family protein [Methanosarcinales archaeon]